MPPDPAAATGRPAAAPREGEGARWHTGGGDTPEAEGGGAKGPRSADGRPAALHPAVLPRSCVISHASVSRSHGRGPRRGAGGKRRVQVAARIGRPGASGVRWRRTETPLVLRASGASSAGVCGDSRLLAWRAWASAVAARPRWTRLGRKRRTRPGGFHEAIYSLACGGKLPTARIGSLTDRQAVPPRPLVIVALAIGADNPGGILVLGGLPQLARWEAGSPATGAGPEREAALRLAWRRTTGRWQKREGVCLSPSPPRRLRWRGRARGPC